MWLDVVFSVVWRDECEGGFVCGDLESVFSESFFQLVYILLEVCGGGLVFGVL